MSITIAPMNLLPKGSVTSVQFHVSANTPMSDPPYVPFE